ncbi:iron-sulfur cluster-binding protein [Rhodococcoides trifolii]|uniref:Iron-sulfur cluster-binding protein n=1 Tax=Rhodococcoides trifolii TaxID=908250 RepID=A0A917CZA3_9NOCA|nr:LutB/LldF family L-lactate oxidation iron-sulfur protein [Rhodococcus trifolii]GGG03236.1 iron-sulfur cluster-binding protein [Rhodococcus trifolii]
MTDTYARSTTIDSTPHPSPPVFLGTPGLGNIRGTESFPKAAHRTLQDTQMRRNVGAATRTIREKRLQAIGECDDWEDLRLAGSAIKTDVMSRLPELLDELEANIVARGGVVHWARDADEANRIITDLVRATGSDEVVKVKSMATQETGLNEYLEAEGIAAIETDLAELIVQLGEDKPSHILVPAIHRNRAEIREIFLRRMPGIDPDVTDEPRALAMAAREHLRKKFLSAKVAISGANFGVAETGTLAVVESEGNGRMCLTLPDTLITLMGIEKLVPTFADLEVFMQLLPRSSTAERMNPYTSMWTGVHDGDGPQHFHLVLLDNGRTNVLADEVGRAALNCIRCSACLNVCPVYERTGGHAYGSVYPGPIGAILSPQLTGTTGHDDPNASLPYASSLCGACFDACPVRINIPDILVHLRAKQVDSERGGIPGAQELAMKAAGWAMGSPTRFGMAEKAAGVGRLLAGKSGKITSLPFPGSLWTSARDLPAPPKETFRQWWARTHEDNT